MSTVLTVIEIIGVLSFSISGALMAIDKENDFFGVVFLAIITSFGGGILRDIFIGNTPPLFFGLFYLIIVSVITSTVVFLIATIFKKQYVKNEDFVQRINNYLDAAGLGVFVISGARICMEAGFTNPFLIVVMGMLSGTGGSMTRDIIMREVPALLRKHIYLMAALAGATIYYFLVRFGVPNVFAVPIGVTSIVVIRLLAIAFKWNMPKAIDFTKLGEENK
jgi:uncharacterized membrane protein YeiH